MIDIWMLFTMTVPFLEVALLTYTEVMRRRGVPHFSRDGRVHQEHLELSQPGVLPAWVGVVGRLLLPIISLLFIVTFWVVGLIASYWSTAQQGPNMTDCLMSSIDAD